MVEQKSESQELIKRMGIDAVQAAMVTGCMIKHTANPKESEYRHVPFALFPIVFPLKHYKRAMENCTIMGSLLAGIIREP